MSILETEINRLSSLGCMICAITSLFGDIRVRNGSYGLGQTSETYGQDLFLMTENLNGFLSY